MKKIIKYTPIFLLFLSITLITISFIGIFIYFYNDRLKNPNEFLYYVSYFTIGSFILFAISLLLVYFQKLHINKKVGKLSKLDNIINNVISEHKLDIVDIIPHKGFKNNKPNLKSYKAHLTLEHIISGINLGFENIKSKDNICFDMRLLKEKCYVRKLKNKRLSNKNFLNKYKNYLIGVEVKINMDNFTLYEVKNYFIFIKPKQRICMKYALENFKNHIIEI